MDIIRATSLCLQAAALFESLGVIAVGSALLLGNTALPEVHEQSLGPTIVFALATARGVMMVMTQSIRKRGPEELDPEDYAEPGVLLLLLSSMAVMAVAVVVGAGLYGAAALAGVDASPVVAVLFGFLVASQLALDYGVIRPDSQ